MISLTIRSYVCLIIAGTFLLFTACSNEDQENVQLQQPASTAPGQRNITLTYLADDNGSIEGEAQQTVGRDEDGSMVTAVAAEGYHFADWSDGLATSSRTDRKVTNDFTVVASFSRNQYNLTYTAGENGSITGPKSQTVSYGDDGALVTAEPKKHYHFAGWSDGVATPERADRNVMTDLDVTAGFAADQYNLSYIAESNGSIVGEARQSVTYGKSGSSVLAVPADGYQFTGWNDGIITPSRIEENVTADIAVSAGFSIKKYSLSYFADAHGSISGTRIQEVTHGQNSSEVVAIPEQGYHFVNWSDGVSTARRVESNARADLAVRAIFAVDTFIVGGIVKGLVEGTRLVLQNNAGDDLVISADGEFFFVDELQDKNNYMVTVLSQPTAPDQICAVTSGSGTINADNVKDISVACVLKTYQVGGMLSGLPADEEVVIQINEQDPLALQANGVFSFPSPLEDGTDYEIRVVSPPAKPNWTCDVSNAIGSISGGDVADVTVDCYVKAILQATPGLNKIKLNWNSRDFKNVTFNLCQGRTEISTEEFINCQKIEGRALETGISPPHVVSGLMNDVPYWFLLEVRYADSRRTYSEVVQSMAYGGLNDSGIDWCANDNVNYQTDGTRSEKNESCYDLAGNHPAQDGMQGRDALSRARKLVKSGNGSAGFDFTPLCRSGEVAGEGKCPPNPSSGNSPGNLGCIRDNVTGLTWEVKATSGLQAQSNTFSWYNPINSVNGGDPGKENGGKCQGSSCDTRSYVLAINDMGLCGISDWRLPTREELLSIVDNSRFKPAVDPRVLPNTSPDYYWSSSPYADQNNSAWQVYFLYGESYPGEKSLGRHVRLVSGRTMTFGLENP
jgi:hypothetical protein